MNRHIKVKATLVHPDNEYVDMTVVYTTHTGVNFGGNSGKFISDVFDHGNVKLRAKGGQSPYTTNGQDNGRHEITLGSDVVGVTARIPIKVWPEVKEAINEYNRWGDSGGKQVRGTSSW